MARDLIELVRIWVDARTILLVTVFGVPVVTLFVWGGRMVQQ